MKIKKLVHLLWIIPLLILIGICALFALTSGAMVFDVARDYLTWEEATHPLDDAVIDDLCKEFDIPSSDPRCNKSNSGDVYGPDFFKEVYVTFTPEDGKWSTYDEVEEAIGQIDINLNPSLNNQMELSTSDVYMILQGTGFFQWLSLFTQMEE